MSDTPAMIRVVAAQARSEAARARLSDSVGALQERADPRVLAQDVVGTVKERSADALAGLAESARRKPADVGVALVIAGVFLARKPVVRLLRRATSAKAKS